MNSLAVCTCLPVLCHVQPQSPFPLCLRDPQVCRRFLITDYAARAPPYIRYKYCLSFILQQQHELVVIDVHQLVLHSHTSCCTVIVLRAAAAPLQPLSAPRHFHCNFCTTCTCSQKTVIQGIAMTNSSCQRQQSSNQCCRIYARNSLLIACL